MSFTTWLLLLVFFGGLYYAYITFFKPKNFGDSDSSSDSDDSSDEEIEKREFTLEELSKYDGINNPEKKTYISVKGQVFDVTNSGFYGPGEQYHMFAGKDCTVALAKNSIKEEDLNRFDISGLSFSEKDSLEGYLNHIAFKYTEIGWLKEWKDFHKEKGEKEKKQD